MKRESNDSHYSGDNTGEGPLDREQLLGDGPPQDGSPAGAGDALLGDLNGWDREDFEAALPLYVGGDLDSAEAKRVDAWLAAHPEDQTTLAASEAAAGVLARYAQISHQRETPDLWAGIRSELVQSRVLKDGVTDESAPERLAPILGGPRWFQRKSVAAAAALLLTTSAGLMMMDRGADSGAGWMPPAGSGAGMVAESATERPSLGASSGGSVSGRDVEADLARRVTEGTLDLGPVVSRTLATSSAVRPGDHRLAGHGAGALQGSPAIQLGTEGNPMGAVVPVGLGRGEPLRPAGPHHERLVDEGRAHKWFWIEPWDASRTGPQLTGGRR